MGEINKSVGEQLNYNRLRRDYAKGKGAEDGQLRLGIEIESWFMNTAAARSGKIVMMTPMESQAVFAEIAKADPTAQLSYEIKGARVKERVDNAPLVCVDSRAVSYQLELCGVLEAATAPILASDPRRLLALVKQAQQVMSQAAQTQGLTYFSGAVPGSILTSDCAANMVDRERLRAEWAKFTSGGPASAGLRTMGLASSAQVSIGYRDMLEADEIIVLGNLLAPAFYAAFSNTTGYIEGRQSDNLVPRADWWMQHNKVAPRAGIPARILQQMFSPAAGRELLETWIDYVQRVPMVYYWDEAGTPRFDTSPTFNQLAARGLGTTQNFALAESLLWPDVKVIGGQRIELRAADSGPYQPAALAILASEIFANPSNRRMAIKEVMAASQITADQLQLSREKVGLMGNKAPYGRANVGQISQLMKDWIKTASCLSRSEANAVADNLVTGTERLAKDNPEPCQMKAAVKTDLLCLKGI